VLGPPGTGGAGDGIGVWVGEGEGEEGVLGVEDEEVGRREGGVMVRVERGRERDLAAFGAGESVDDDDAGFPIGCASAAEEVVAARGRQKPRFIRGGEVGAVRERLREDGLGEGDDAAGSGIEEERGQAGAEEVGGGGAEQAAPGLAGGRKGVDRAEAGEEAAQDLREGQLGQAAPVAELRHRGPVGGERACLNRFHCSSASQEGTRNARSVVDPLLVPLSLVPWCYWSRHVGPNVNANDFRRRLSSSGPNGPEGSAKWAIEIESI